jgi:hypothetical protein
MGHQQIITSPRRVKQIRYLISRMRERCDSELLTFVKSKTDAEEQPERLQTIDEIMRAQREAAG